MQRDGGFDTVVVAAAAGGGADIPLSRVHVHGRVRNAFVSMRGMPLHTSLYMLT
jgi:hypothetical protein